MPALSSTVTLRRPVATFVAVIVTASLSAVSPLGGVASARPTEDAGTPDLGIRTTPAPDYVPGELIVGFRRGLAKADRRVAVGRTVAAARLDDAVLPNVHVVTLAPGVDVPSAVGTLERTRGVAWAEPNWIRQPLFVPNDPMYGSQWSIPRANVDEAWDMETGDPSMAIAVIDSGVRTDHADLTNNIWSNPGETQNGADDDGNGKVDDVAGWDFNGDDAVPEDDDGHGTHVAGIAAAEGNNSIGISGVCPGCSIMPLRVANNQGGLPLANVVQATRYAVDEGARVINMSFGGPAWSRAERQAIMYANDAGVLVVAAAGNESLDNDALSIDGGFIVGPSYPASYDLPNVVAVAASTSTDRLATYSNVGTTSVDLAAPGSGIRSTWRNGAYNTISGTSMASPFVAGVAALLRSQNPGWTPVQTKNAIMNAVARPNHLVSPRTLTDGRVDALAALQQADTSNATPVHDGTMAGAKPLASRRSGTVSVPRDVNDIFSKRLRRGRTYTATLRVPARRDFDLFVWKPTAQDTWPIEIKKGRLSQLTAVGAEPAGVDEVVRIRVRRTGVYHFHVNAWRGAGRYVLTVRS
ncbi:MAG TPA: S8 family peptidase [Actinomycetota bacterium]|nr:S8 family peptidase [Actinomycetota bacterium]